MHVKDDDYKDRGPGRIKKGKEAAAGEELADAGQVVEILGGVGGAETQGLLEGCLKNLAA